MATSPGKRECSRPSSRAWRSILASKSETGNGRYSRAGGNCRSGGWQPPRPTRQRSRGFLPAGSRKRLADRSWLQAVEDKLIDPNTARRVSELIEQGTKQGKLPELYDMQADAREWSAGIRTEQMSALVAGPEFR
jgi:hypothetical protein